MITATALSVLHTYHASFTKRRNEKLKGVKSGDLHGQFMSEAVFGSTLITKLTRKG